MELKECEGRFQTELTLYRLDGNKRSWDKMWELVHFCCSNLAKLKLKGVRCPEFDGKVMDATIKCMELIKGGQNPKALSAFCYYPVIGVIWDRKLQKEERTISFEAWQDYELAREEQ